MTKNISIFFLLFFAASAAGAMEFKDVPDNHWAHDAVYELAKTGIASGFPDGTFRGSQNITRYEACVMLSKLAGQTGIKEEKVLAELKSEVALIKYKRQQQPVVGFNAEARLLAPNSQIEADYRLKAAYRKPGFDLTLDTLDAGFGSAVNRDFIQFLSVELSKEMDGLAIFASSGPGDILHADANIPSENDLVYARPYNSLGLKTRFESIDILSTVRFREPYTELDSSFSYTFYNKFWVKKLRLSVRPRLFVGGGKTNLTTEISKYFAFSNYQNHLITVGIGNYADLPHSLAVFYAFNIRNDSTRFTFNAGRIGSLYRKDFNYFILNEFDHAFQDGTTDISCKLSHDISKGLSAYLTDNVVIAGTAASNTFQAGIAAGMLEVFYRVCETKDPAGSTSLLAGVIRL